MPEPTLTPAPPPPSPVSRNPSPGTVVSSPNTVHLTIYEP
jgi:hypothetical protein